MITYSPYVDTLYMRENLELDEFDNLSSLLNELQFHVHYLSREYRMIRRK